MQKNVIFISTGYYPEIEELHMFDSLQAEIRNAHFGIERDSETQYEVVLRKQSLANRLRETLHLAPEPKTACVSEGEHDPNASRHHTQTN